MATPQSVEHQTLVACTDKLKLAFKSSLDSIGTELFAKRLISSQVLEKVQTVGIVDSVKATEIVMCLTDQIIMCPSSYHDFMALESFQEPFLKPIHDLLTAEYERLKASATSQKELSTELTSSQAGSVVKESPDGRKKGQKMKQIVLNKIKRQFASLLLNVRRAMDDQPVEVKDFHQFLVSFFQGVCSIPEVSDLTKMFNVVTEAELWSYHNYGPVEDLVVQFLPTNESVGASVTDYINQYSGFCATVNIIEYKDLLEE